MRPVDRWAHVVVLVLAVAVAGCEDEGPPVVPLSRLVAQPVAPQADPFVPRRTRAGFLRISTKQVHDHPAACAELLARLDRATDSELRAALVEALPRTGGAWVGEVLARLPDEADPAVRKAMVATMARAEPARAVVGIGRGIRDDDVEVRIEAAVVAGSLPLEHLQSSLVLADLIVALEDEHGPVRAAAARSLGIVRAVEAADALAAMRNDSEEPVRRQADRALARLDEAAGLR